MLSDRLPGELVALHKQTIDCSSPIPRHAQVKAILLGAVHSGVWEPGTKIPAETEIARVLKVSKMTANRAITDLASEGVFIRELGRGTFVRSSTNNTGHPEQDQIRRRAHVILRLVTSGPASDVPDNEYLCSLMLAIRTSLSPTDAVIKISQIPGSDYISAFERNRDERWVVIAPTKDDLIGLRALARAHYAAVVLGASWPGIGLPAVDSDNCGGMYLAVEHLVGLGHTTIGMIYADPETSNTIDRITAFHEAMKSHGLQVNGKFLVDAHDDMGIRADVREQLALLLRSNYCPSAWVAAGPYVAMALLELAHTVGISVPGDLSIVGFDYPAALAARTPSLTTVCQPLAEMGSTAARLITNPSGEEVVYKLPCSLAVRGSTAVVRSISNNVEGWS